MFNRMSRMHNAPIDCVNSFRTFIYVYILNIHVYIFKRIQMIYEIKNHVKVTNQLFSL